MAVQYLIQVLLLLALPLSTLSMPPPVTVAEAQTEVQRLITTKEAASIAKLAPLWSALPPIRVEKAIGTYKGGLFDGPSAKKSPINWWGKQIINETSVNPLLSNAPNDTSIVFPYPRVNIAQARNVEHEGVVSATIVYNRLPIMDYFRVVHEDPKTGTLVLLGKSDLLGKASDPPYFWLRKTEGVTVDMHYKNPYPNTSGF